MSKDLHSEQPILSTWMEPFTCEARARRVSTPIGFEDDGAQTRRCPLPAVHPACSGRVPECLRQEAQAPGLPKKARQQRIGGSVAGET